MGQLSIYTEKNEVGPLYHTTYKSHSNRIKELNEITITMKYLEENIRYKFSNIGSVSKNQNSGNPSPKFKTCVKGHYQ